MTPSNGGPRSDVSRATRVRVVGTISVATMLAMSVWFSASFIVADLRLVWGMPAAFTGLLSFGLQIGFIAGAMLSSLLGLVERIGSRRIFFSAAMSAGALNLALLVTDDFRVGIVLRFLTGVALAGIYPVAMKDVLEWVGPRHRGRAAGLLIGSLTIGSAAPHLVVATVPTSWEAVVVATSALVACAGICYLIGVPRIDRSPRAVGVTFGGVVGALRVKPVRLALYGYLGHMWELYAMWACIGLFLSSRADRIPASTVSLAAFAVIAVGAVGAAVSGALGDRFGKERIVELSLWLSGSCAVATVFADSLSFAVLVGLCAVWGFWVIADSGLLSAILGEVAPPSHLGSLVAFQLASGYAISSVTVLAIPFFQDIFAWEYVLPFLAVGPALGLVAIRALRRGRESRGWSRPA